MRCLATDSDHAISCCAQGLACLFSKGIPCKAADRLVVISLLAKQPGCGRGSTTMQAQLSCKCTKATLWSICLAASMRQHPRPE